MIRSTLSDGRVAQIVGIPPLAAITTGVQSASRCGQPDQAAVAPGLARAQCDVLASSRYEYLVVYSAVIPSLQAGDACEGFSFKNACVIDPPKGAAEPCFSVLPLSTAG